MEKSKAQLLQPTVEVSDKVKGFDFYAAKGIFLWFWIKTKRPIYQAFNSNWVAQDGALLPKKGYLNTCIFTKGK